MKLIIDIGNTAVKMALFKDKQLLNSSVFNECNIENVLAFIGGAKISATIISSVRAINDAVRAVSMQYNALLLSENTPLPISIDYKTPDTLGKDRVAAVVGASYCFNGKDVLVIDAGTCLTIDFIKADKHYIGGRISPGLAMRFAALHEFTAKLPLIKRVNDSKLIGNDTESSIISGVQEGIIAEVETIITTFRKENNDTIVIITGGDCFFFEKALKNSIFANSFLVMEGLNEILDYNE